MLGCIVAIFKGEKVKRLIKVKRWKGERVKRLLRLLKVKGWKGEKVKRWLTPPMQLA